MKNDDYSENKDLRMNESEDVKSVAQVLSPGILMQPKAVSGGSNDRPGGNGRGAIYICSNCGNQYANTGVGCPICNKK